jgi:hypothetical protein
MLIKEYYGIEMIEMHVQSIKHRKKEKNQYLRSLAQHDHEIVESKSKLPPYYLLKILMLVYWFNGERNFQ